MGYTTDFNGTLKLSKAATQDQINYLNTFSATRRMKRDVDVLQRLYGGEYGFNGSYGREGEYFAKNDGNFGQSRDASILDYNEPPLTPNLSLDNFGRDFEKRQKMIENGEAVPGLWCQWVLNDDGTELEWNGGEKFYNYVEWLKYLIAHFFSVWGIQLNGEITWQGEDSDDLGKIVVTNNEVSVKKGEIVYR